MGAAFSACFSDTSDGASAFETYQVVGSSGGTVRAGESLKSPMICTLPPGTLLKVDTVRGRRCHIVEPVRGWGSTSTEKGYVIIEKVSKLADRFRVIATEGTVVLNVPDGTQEVRLLRNGETIQSTGKKTQSNGVEWIQIEDGWVAVTKRKRDDGSPGEALLRKLP